MTPRPWGESMNTVRCLKRAADLIARSLMHAEATFGFQTLESGQGDE